MEARFTNKPSELRNKFVVGLFAWFRGTRGWADEGDADLLQLRRQLGLLAGVPPARPDRIHLA